LPLISPLLSDPVADARGHAHQTLNVYLWDDGEQDRALTEALAPTLRALREDAALRRAWVHRFDVRGPHLMVVLGGPAERADEVRRRLAAALDAHLAAAGEAGELDTEVLRRRHAECRGRALNPLDALDGFAPNRSYAFAGQDPAEAYVFRRAAGMDVLALEPLLAELAGWCADRVRAGGTTASAVGWVAGLTRGMREAGLPPAPFWRYYASTLLLSLTARIQASDPEIVAGLPRLVGERNERVLGRMWDEAEAAPSAWPGASELVRIAAAAEVEEEARHLFLRELSHGVFAQLGLHVQIRIPLVLYAWQRTLSER
jgi:hypothetical protein